MADLVTLRSDALTATIHPLGAELWSLKDAEGRELMTDADPAFWTGHAPLLFPIVGALAGGQYRLGERSFAMAKHGFARRSGFALVEADAARALFRLEASEETRAQYPFDFRLDMGFALDGAKLAMTATIGNQGATPMPFSFGYHPAFAWPLPFGGVAEDHRVVFERDEPAPIRRLDPATGLVAPTPQPSPVDGKVYAPVHADFEADALIWDELSSRSLTYGVPGQPQLRIDFPDTPMLGIWQKPGARYLCIEPWAGIADPLGFAGDFSDKPGVTILAPGVQQRLRMDVTLEQPALL
ncbi:aldose 1-epimerase family protein [Blastomonas sp. SL216]|uniref:aldose 1-epimerase family protein n=1 Tax=Blastomonas sp. SL216 TaxID=2995169 RepID=UPI002376D956|nr:aldose 1-epimerase family protein [Blastomonas sp. SL216]